MATPIFHYFIYAVQYIICPSNFFRDNYSVSTSGIHAAFLSKLDLFDLLRLVKVDFGNDTFNYFENLS